MILPDDPSELQKSCNLLATNLTLDELLINRYSNFYKLVRVVSVILKYVFRIKPSLDKFDKNISLRTRSIYILRKTSQKCYRFEILSLENGEQLSKKSSLLALSPPVDQYEILCVGGPTIDLIVTKPLIVHLSLYTRLKPTCDKKIGIMGLVYIFNQRAFNCRAAYKHSLVENGTIYRNHSNFHTMVESGSLL